MYGTPRILFINSSKNKNNLNFLVMKPYNIKRVKQGKEAIHYKGFCINFIGSSYRAEAYANPSFYSTNLEDIKKQINQYLKS